MQTPRGFLIGAGVIAAIAAFASVGHPRSETAVHVASPPSSFVEQTPTINSSSSNSDVDVLAQRVEAGDAMPSTTMELAEPVPKLSVSPSTTIAAASDDEIATTPVDEERHRPSAANTEASTTPPTTPPTTVAAATTPSTSSPSSTTTTVPSLPLLPTVPVITIPVITMPPITVPQPVAPIVTPPQIQIPAVVAPFPIVNSPVIEPVDITRRAASVIAYDLPAA